MERFWITIAVALPLIPVFWAMLLHFDPPCGGQLIEEQRSPDGHYLAAVMERNCGATTRYVEHINLRRADRNFPSGLFDGTVKDGEIFTLENRNGGGRARCNSNGSARNSISTTRQMEVFLRNIQLGMM
jgi:hypothetical protein